MSGILQMLGLPFLACLLLTGILSYLGLHVLQREVIFIDIAMAQFAALGAVIAHVGFGLHADTWGTWAASLTATLLASAFFATTRQKIRCLHIEAVIGISYAVAAAAALMVIGKGAGGHTHIQQMLSGSILWTTGRDLGRCAVVFVFVGGCFYLFRRPFRVLSRDYGQAGAARPGTRAARGERGSRRVHHGLLGWDFLFYALCGVVITVSVALAGVVVVFTFLIIPATVSALVCKGWGARLLVAWACGAAASVAGLLFGYYLDFSAGVSVSMFLGVLLLAAALTAKRPVESRPAPGG